MGKIKTVDSISSQNCEFLAIKIRNIQNCLIAGIHCMLLYISVPTLSIVEGKDFFSNTFIYELATCLKFYILECKREHSGSLVECLTGVSPASLYCVLEQDTFFLA